MNTVVQLKTRVERWAEKISAAHGESVQAIIDVGRQLLQAQAECSAGEWGELIGRTTGQSMLPFHRTTAQRLMAIAESALANGAHGLHLPASWRTLAILATLDPEDIESAIADGAIHPEMQRKDAEALVAKLKPRGQPAQAEPQRTEPAQVLTLPLAPRLAEVAPPAAEAATHDEDPELSAAINEQFRALGQRMIAFAERQKEQEAIDRETYRKYPELREIEAAAGKALDMAKDLERLIRKLPNIPVYYEPWGAVDFYLDLASKQLKEKLL